MKGFSRRTSRGILFFLGGGWGKTSPTPGGRSEPPGSRFASWRRSARAMGAAKIRGEAELRAEEGRQRSQQPGGRTCGLASWSLGWGRWGWGLEGGRGAGGREGGGFFWAPLAAMTVSSKIVAR